MVLVTHSLFKVAEDNREFETLQRRFEYLVDWNPAGLYEDGGLSLLEGCMRAHSYNSSL